MKHIFRTILVAAMAMLTVGFVGCSKDDNNNGSGNAANNTRYTLTVQPNNTEWGTTTGGGSYADGTRVYIEAVANQGYYFIKWSDGAVSNPRIVTVSSNLTLYALFSSNPNDPNPYNPGDNPTPGPGPNPQPVPDGWVDLGLPSGLLWAECNVGATAPEEYGDYIAWGETHPKNYYYWSTYAHGRDYNQITKYCSMATLGLNGFTDTLTILESGDDAATVRLGNGAHIPTLNEWLELKNTTTAEWTTLNGVNGMKFIGSNGNSIFLPAAGMIFKTDLSDVGSYGDYWSSSLVTTAAQTAWIFNFGSDILSVSNRPRPAGISVRAVRSKHQN